jgi:diguanylate cyclase (GGDEF)-like protein
MRCNGRLLLILMSVLLALASLPAWSQQYSLQTYDRKAGLESLSINVLMQDRHDFIWAGTEIGLYRFDGNNFELMGAAQGFDKSEYVTSIEQNPHIGLLWVATQSGLRVGDGLHFDKVVPDNKPLVVDVGRPMAALDDGRLLLVRDKQLMVLSQVGRGRWQVRPLFDTAQLAAHPQLRNITAIYALKGHLWLGCDVALCEIDVAGKVVVNGPEQGVPADSWSGMLMDRHGNLWLRGVHHVRVLLAGATSFITREVPQNDMDVVNDDGSFVEDPEGRILTSTNHGLARWDGTGWTAINSSNGLPDIGITARLFDRQGALWLGTYGRGIARWSGYGLVESWGRAQGFDSVPTWSILRSGNQMWFGNELGGSTLTDGQTRLQPWPLQIAPTPRQALTMARAGDGAIWIGLYDRRVLRYDPASGRTTLAAQLPDFVKVLHVDRQQRLWIATVNGIYRIDSVGTPARRIPAAQTTDQQCSDIAEGNDGTLWFACNEGLLRYAGTQWTHMQTGRNATLASGFSTVAVGADGKLWLGANEPGVFQAIVHGGQLAVTHIADTWLDKSLAYFIRRDHRGWIWVGGGGGVDIFDGQRWTHLSRDDGLLWDETDQNAFFEDRDGSVWIGSAIGVSHVLHPEAMIAPSPRKVIITSAMHGNSPVKAGDSVRVDGNSAPLTVRYILLGASSSSPPEFRYRLQGSDWVQTTSNIINLTGLRSDDYRLEIQAIDDDHRTISPPSYFDFRIPPPWWRAWWATLLQLLALVLIVTFGWRWYSRRLLHQNRRLETLVAGRTVELTEEKRELEMARAELYYQATHDGLTGLYNRNAILDELAAQLEHRAAPGLAVGLIDADHFKRINDTYGHQAGDAALVEIARHLQAHVRNGDRLGRYGGEEILMLLPGISRIDAEHRMRSIQAAVSAMPHSWDAQRFEVTLSIGMVWIGYEPASPEDLIRRADAALYQAKRRGRDRVVAELMAG